MRRSILKLLILAVLLDVSSVIFAQENASEQALVAAVQANPKDPRAHFNLGLIYFNGAKYEQAAREFQKCLQINSDDKQSRDMFEISQGLVAYNANNFSDAANHFQNAVKANPEDTDANVLLGDCYVKLKQYQNAENSLKSYLKVSSKGKARVGIILAKIYLDQQRYPEGIAELKNVVEAEPKNFDALQNLGVAYFQTKDYKNAANYWEKAIKIHKDTQTLKFLGFSYYNLGNFSDAIDNYKKSIKVESSKPVNEQNLEALGETYYNLAIAYSDNSLFDDAAEAFKQAFKINPKDSNAAIGQAQAIKSATDTHLVKGDNLAVNGQYGDAIAEWNKALQYDPTNEHALSSIKDAQPKMKFEVDKYYASGKAYAKKGETIKALNEWSLGQQMDPSDERFQKAITGLNAKKKDRVKALIAEAEGYYEAKDFAAALKDYQKAKEIDPENEKVRKRLKQLKSKQSDASDTVYAKAKKSYSNGDLKNALKYLEQAKEINPNSAEVASFLFKVQKDITLKVKALDAEGVSLFDGGNKEKAAKKFQEVLALKSSDETANDYVKKMTGQQSQAKVDAEKVKALYYEGVSLYINGKIHEAIAKWQECQRLDPGNVNAQKNIEKAQAKLQSIEKLNKS